MALTPAKSAEYTKHDAVPRTFNLPEVWGGKLRASSGSLTFTVAGQGTAQMIRMPAGRVRIYPDLCRLVVPAGAAGALVDLGTGAYTNEAGTSVAAAAQALEAGLANTGAIDAAPTLPAVGYLDINSQAGFDITFAVGTANSASSGEVFVLIVYSMGN